MARRRRAASAAQAEKSPDELLGGLNPEQLEVAQHDRGPLIVGAVAGSGKTTALVRRVGYLVQARGVGGDRILALTFSVKAAKEMNERLWKLVPDSGARIGTFHSLGFQFVREELRLDKDWEVDDRDRYRTVVKDALGFRGMKWDAADLTAVLQYIGLCKAMCAPAATDSARDVAEEYYAEQPCGQRTPSLLAEAYFRAEELRQERRMLTYDDMLLETWKSLDGDPTIRARWAAKWDYVLQDECQDENLVQREIARMLAEPHGNYMVVGDPAQAIYGFRGSDPTGMLEFEAKWSARVVHMNRNYRSGRAIIKVANRVLESMSEGTHLGMTMQAERDYDGQVDVRHESDADSEAESVAQRMGELGADGTQWRDMVVLYRTNAQSRALEERLLGARIPYVVVGGTNFYDRKEVKDLVAYLRLAAGRGGWDDVRRCLNAPFRYLGRAFLDKVEMAGESAETGESWTSIVRELADGAGGLQQRQRVSAHEWAELVEAMARAIDDHRKKLAEWQAAREGMTDAQMVKAGLEVPRPNLPNDDDEIQTERFLAAPERLIENLLDETGYIKWLTRDEGTESPENNRVSNVRELVRAAGRFTTVDALLDYIDETVRASKASRGGEQEAPDRVTLMSIHRSKGLEWPAVFVVGCSEKILPHGRGDLDEERRLFYVACTRARDYLHLSSVAAIGETGNLPPSRFLAEAGLGGSL